VGLGAGWHETEFRAFGVPYDRRAARFVDAFDVIRRLLAGERVSTPDQMGTAGVTGATVEIAARLRDFAEAGVDEAILVVTPITEESIRVLAPVVAALR
jgi:alkanesulfonate monooxygenase SsuD/methylene tetrahydromethanopterin reductase-like flavin-dependent oxidoreductase (luciferase family)